MRIGRLVAAIAVVSAGLMPGGAAAADSAQPATVGSLAVNLSLAQSAIAEGQGITFTFNVVNSSSTTDYTGVAFSLVLPSGLNSTPVSGAACGTGTMSVVSKTVSLTGGKVSKSSSCSFGILVYGNTAGVYNLQVGTVTASGGITGHPGSATFTVISRPVLTAAFNPTKINTIGSGASLVFTISNQNATVSLTGLTLTTTLPAALSVTSGTSAACGGQLALTAPHAVALAGGTLGHGASCSLVIHVSPSAAGTFTASAAAVATNSGTGNTATASITVIGLTLNTSTPGPVLATSTPTPATGGGSKATATAAGAGTTASPASAASASAAESATDTALPSDSGLQTASAESSATDEVPSASDTATSSLLVAAAASASAGASAAVANATTGGSGGGADQTPLLLGLALVVVVALGGAMAFFVRRRRSIAVG